MARNKEWADAWNAHIDDLKGLAWVPNEADQVRMLSIITELKEIVRRNKEVLK